MTLLDKLKLTPPQNNAAKRSVVRRARLAARLARGERRAVLEAAVDMASVSKSNDAKTLDLVVDDEKNPDAPVSRQAPRSAYDDLLATDAENEHLAGRIDTDRGFGRDEYEDARTHEHLHTDFDVRTKVLKRGLVPENLGKGERTYTTGAEGRLRRPSGVRPPEDHVTRHEHLHLVIAAHVSARIDEFADAAFGKEKFDDHRFDALVKLLGDIADEAEDEVQEWLDDVTIAKDSHDVPDAVALGKKLLADGTIEKRVRTALLRSLRKHSRRLAEFRTAR